MAGYAIENGTLKVQLHHYAEGLGKTRVHSHREVQCAHCSRFNKPGEGGKWLTETKVHVGFLVVAFRWRTEGPFNRRVIVEQR